MFYVIIPTLTPVARAQPFCEDRMKVGKVVCIEYIGQQSRLRAESFSMMRKSDIGTMLAIRN